MLFLFPTKIILLLCLQGKTGSIIPFLTVSEIKQKCCIHFSPFLFEVLDKYLQDKSGKYRIKLLLMQIMLKVAFIRRQGWQDCNALGV